MRRIPGNEGFGQSFLAVLPHQLGHVLSLGQHRPDEQLVEGLREDRSRQLRRVLALVGQTLPVPARSPQSAAAASRSRRKAQYVIAVPVHHLPISLFMIYYHIILVIQ